MTDNDRTDEELEVYERIPWSDLLAEHERARQWLPYAAVALAAVAATAGFILLSRRGDATKVTLAPPPAVSEVPRPAEPALVPVPAAAPPQLYSEADLMASLPIEEDRQLSARAEWFVIDFFTSDGDVNREAALGAHLPAGALPALESRPGVRTYVEWAKTLRVEEVSPSRFELLVAFRTLSAPPDQAFVRDPVRAVIVPVVVDSAGEVAIADLPTPSDLPQPSTVADWTATGITPPDTVLAEARSALSLWGDDPQIVQVSITEAGWRIMGTVTDTSGVSWPLAVRVDASG